MISRRTLLAATGAGLVTTGWSARALGAEPTFTAREIQEDLDVIWNTLPEVSPEPFRTSDANAVEALYRRTRAKMTSPMTVREAWLAIAPVLGSLNDGHVSLGFPEELNKAAFRFPLHFTISEPDGYLIVASDRTETIARGSRVLSVEGIPATDYFHATMRAFGGQTPALVRSRVSGAGAWTAVALFGDKAAYRVRWRDPVGAEHEALIGSEAASSKASTVDRRSDPYSFRWVRAGVGLIDYRHCEDLARFKTFLDDTFTQLQTARAKALIIDIRHNSGGDSDLNNLLWSYAQGRPFKQFGGTVERSSALLKQAYGRDKYVRIYGEKAWAAPDGEVLKMSTAPDADLVVPEPLPIRFTGPVYLLISTATFSSGMSCALAAKDYGLATIVGQETGEPASGTGELYKLITPNVRFPAYLTTKVFLAPKPHPVRRGVIPDIVVPAATSSLESADHDAVLARTLALIP